jgi:hypothetical protein
VRRRSCVTRHRQLYNSTFSCPLTHTKPSSKIVLSTCRTVKCAIFSCFIQIWLPASSIAPQTGGGIGKPTQQPLARLAPWRDVEMDVQSFKSNSRLRGSNTHTEHRDEEKIITCQNTRYFSRSVGLSLEVSQLLHLQFLQRLHSAQPL